MSEVFLGRGARRTSVPLGSLLGEGAAGKVHLLPSMHGMAAKLYHTADVARAYEAKIDAMLASPPDLPPAVHNGIRYPQIAWPEAKLFDGGGKFVGFVMPEIDFARSTSLVNLLQKNSRRHEKLSDYYGYRVLVARNLASVFAELHRAGHHMIDMKPANLRFYPSVSWMAVVDTDGFSIAGNAAGSRGRIAAERLSDDYIAPESWKKDPGELGLAQDRFALAVIIFQLLDNGVHPFAGTPRAGEATDLQTRILDGLYPYSLKPGTELAPSTASIHRMFRRNTRAMFDRAFEGAVDDRPGAEEWRDHLDLLLGQLVPCAAKPGEHVHFGAGCGFCSHEARVAATKAKPRRTVQRDPVPAQRRPLQPRPLQLQHRFAGPRPGARVPPGMRHRPRGKSWRVPAAVLSAIIAVLATQDIWRPMVPGATAAAAEEAIPFAGSERVITAFAEPRDYLVAPPDGAASVPLRIGPGKSFSETERLGINDVLIGRGTRAGTDGVTWVWVTRVLDGVSGFVPETALVQREPDMALAALSPVRADCSDMPSGCSVPRETDPSPLTLDLRYSAAREGAGGRDTADLVRDHRLWVEQRRGCEQLPDPTTCRLSIDARWTAQLETWESEQSFLRHQKGIQGGETPATAEAAPAE